MATEWQRSQFGYYSGVTGGVGDRTPSEFDDYFKRAGFSVAEAILTTRSPA